jgi:predicted nucleotidyltransferase
MRRDEALDILRTALPELRSRYAVKDIAVFGSVARDEAGPNSDVDLLVEFEPGQAGGYFKFFALQEDLERRMHQAVDLVTPDALKRQLRERILAEAIHAA